MSNDLPFYGIMSLAKTTSPKGDIAHGHYTIPVKYNSIPLLHKPLAGSVYLQIYPAQTAGAR